MKNLKQTKIITENWNYKIKFTKDSFWPYEQKFGRVDCYYNDKLQDRWSVLFPYKNKEFDNTEIFLETDDVIVCTWDRTNLSGKEKSFIDIINLKTEKKQRLYVEEVNLIYNSRNEIVVNANFDWVWKTVKLDQETMEIKEEKEEKLFAFFKVLYNEKQKKWYRLDFIEIEKWNFKRWSFEINKIDNKLIITDNFDRKKFELKWNKYEMDYWDDIKFDIWNLSCDWVYQNFLNNQNYVMSEKLVKKVLYDEQLVGSIILISIIIIPSIYIVINSFNNVKTDNEGNFIHLIILLLFIIFYIISKIIKYYNYINHTQVYRHSFSNKFNPNDFEIVRNKSHISSKKQKIMIK